MKRRELEKELLRAGFKHVHSSKHERYQKGDTVVSISRQREIPEATAKKILRQAGLR